MDRMTKQQRSETMRKIRSTKTGFEQKIFSDLRKSGVRFSTHYSRIPGKPDVAQPKFQKAVFLHSDFWHGWRLPTWEHILSNKYWKNKLNANRARDKRTLFKLRRMGWHVLVLWEHTYVKNPDASIRRIAKFLS